jgi:hypothetical protein
MENSAITRKVNQGNIYLSPTPHPPGRPPHKNRLALSSSASSTISTPYHNLSDLRTTRRNNNLSMQLESHSYGATCCLPGPDTIRRGGQFHPPHLRSTDGPQLEISLDQCEEAACPILDITSQCTDQCVVVACDDPTHPEPSCHVTDRDTVCDSTCTLDDDCADCPGLAELVCYILLFP